MPIQIKVADNYVSSGSAFFKSGGAWLKAKEGYVKVEGTWVKFFVSEFKDFFERANASTLGTSPTGQAWTIGRGTWNIVDGKAQIATAKGTYPIALVDAGLTDFELEANEMVPGVGVIIRAESSNNWWGLVGWNNQVAYTYSYCPQALVNQGYCIVDNICQQTVCPGGYQSSQSCVQGSCIAYAPDQLVGVGCASVYVSGGTNCYYVTSPTTSCVNQCIKYCNSCRETCVSQGENCIREDGRTRCFARPPICTTTCSTICCDRDTVCTTTNVTTQVCEPLPGYYETQCTGYEVIPGGCTQYGPDVCTTSVTCPGGTATVNVVCGYPNCAQTGSRQVCPVAQQTATGYNYYYKLYLIKSINGTITVEQDFDIGENFKALRVLGVGPNMAINVYRDNEYGNQIKVLSYSSFNSPAGSNYGIFGYPSNYQEGNTIGSIQVKQPGA
jgi:hypothetical protein